MHTKKKQKSILASTVPRLNFLKIWEVDIGIDFVCPLMQKLESFHRKQVNHHSASPNHPLKGCERFDDEAKSSIKCIAPKRGALSAGEIRWTAQSTKPTAREENRED